MNNSTLNYLESSVKLKPVNPDGTVKIKQKLICLLCGGECFATPISKISNFKKHGLAGCPACTATQRYQEIRLNNLDRLRSRFILPVGVDTDSISNDTLLEVTNKECSHTFRSKLGNLLNRNIICPVCNTAKKKEFYQNLNEERHKNAVESMTGFKQYKLQVYKFTRETYRKFEAEINPKGLIRARSGQRGHHLDHIISVRYCFDSGVPPEVCADKTNLRMIPWQDNAKKWKKPLAAFPEIFFPYIKTPHLIGVFQQQIKKYVKDAEFSVSIGGHSVTALFRDKCIAVMLLPLADNREQICGSKKHTITIQEDIARENFTTICIFEDEFTLKPDLVINKIKHLTGQNDGVRIHARSTVIKPIESKDKNLFLNTHHLQGTSVSQINLGAFNGDELVAVMTFCKPRILMRKTVPKSGEWELARFATDSKYVIPGIGSKLLSYFKKTVEWNSIYSFADKRWSVGRVYDALGFTLERVNPPDYHYIIDGLRKHRWAYRKDALREKFPDKFDDSITEYQNMLRLGYDRVWDCGTLRYEINK